MDIDLRTVFSKVFMWLFVGLAFTFGIAYIVSTNKNMVYNLYDGGKYMIVWIAQLVIIVILAMRINKLSLMSSIVMYLLFSGLMGLTISSIFLFYEIMSIVLIFGIASVLFLLFGLIGYFTKIDLTNIGTILFMFLIGLLLSYLVNMFIGSSTVSLALSVIGLGLFLGYTAYDIQIIKKKMLMIEDQNKLAIYGALQLYIDFIQIFMNLLSLFGRGKD